MRLIESADDIGARVSERKAFAAAKVLGTEPPHVDAVARLVLDRNQLEVVELVRRLEQYALAVERLSLLRVRGPGGVAQREIDVIRMVDFMESPLADFARECELPGRSQERRADARLERLPQTDGV